ncbi:MAG: tRNA (cytidine(34)-2'-O)-methyltransferase [Pseudomonadota bacterium]
MIEIALYQPDIAQNAATSVRLAACLGLTIHIIEPAGFVWNTRDFRRAGMDYIDQANIVRQPDWDAFLAAMADRRIVLATTHAHGTYIDFDFQDDDTLLVGRESAGVPEHVRDSVSHQVSIPMQPGTRSLNVAVATAMITGEAMRQTAWHQG